jgi:hypothetical protein
VLGAVIRDGTRMSRCMLRRRWMGMRRHMGHERLRIMDSRLGMLQLRDHGIERGLNRDAGHLRSYRRRVTTLASPWEILKYIAKAWEVI